MNHTAILDAYLSRLTLSQMEALVAVKQDEAYASLHYGNRAQVEQMERSREVVDEVVAGINDHDAGIIARIVKESTGFGGGGRVMTELNAAEEKEEREDGDKSNNARDGMKHFRIFNVARCAYWCQDKYGYTTDEKEAGWWSEEQIQSLGDLGDEHFLVPFEPSKLSLKLRAASTA